MYPIKPNEFGFPIRGLIKPNEFGFPILRGLQIYLERNKTMLHKPNEFGFPLWGPIKPNEFGFPIRGLQNYLE